jgi:AcrR family transcriptional regulator
MSPKSREQFALVRETARENLLKAAVRIFAANGYHASSMSLIAKEAKVSKGLTYHYFESKEALLIALVERRLQEWLPLVEGLESIQDPIERLYFLIDFVLKELVEHTEKLRFYNSLYLNADGVRAIEQAMKKYQAPFARLSKSERKLFSDLGFSDPEMEAVFLRSQLQGICLEYMLGPKDYPLEKMKEKLVTRYTAIGLKL